MKFICAFFAIIVGMANFYYAWFAPIEQFWMSMAITAMIFAVSFGQYAFKEGEESAVVFLQLASMGFILFGVCNVALIT